MFAQAVDYQYIHCRILIGALLFAKSQGISEEKIWKEVAFFEHSEGREQLATLSELQRETIRGFVQTVYYIDEWFEWYGKSGGEGRYTRVNSMFGRFAKVEKVFRKGRGLAESIQSLCEMEVSVLEKELEDVAQEVVTRNCVPERWVKLVTCVVIFLRQHVQFAKRRREDRR